MKKINIKKTLTVAAFSSAVLLAMVPSMITAAPDALMNNLNPGVVGTLQFEGSTTVTPIIVAAESGCLSQLGLTIANVDANGSTDGKCATVLDYTDIGMASSTLDTASGSGNPATGWVDNTAGLSLAQALHATPIARDGIIMICNSSVPSDITQLTLAQIVDIYMGYDTTWGQIEQQDGLSTNSTMPIVPRARILGSGTRQSTSDLTKNDGDQAIKTITFYTVGGVETDAGAPVGTENYVINQTHLDRLEGNPDMQAAIDSSTATGQIGYVGMGFDSGANIRSLKVVDTYGVAWSGTQQNIYAQNPSHSGVACYPLTRFLYLLTPNLTALGEATPANQTDVNNFMTWITATTGQGSASGQPYAVTAGFLKLIPDADVHIDGVINVQDLGAVGSAVGQTGTAGWIRADVHADGVINVQDLGAVGAWANIHVLAVPAAS